MRLLEFINEKRLTEVVLVPESAVGLRGPDELVIWRRDGSYFVVDQADTLYLSEN